MQDLIEACKAIVGLVLVIATVIAITGTLIDALLAMF